MGKDRMWTVLLLSVLLLGVGAAGPVGAQAPPKMSIMVGGLEKIIYLPAMLTQRLGYFKDAGVDVTLYNEQTGHSAEEEMIAGRVDGVAGFYDHTLDLQATGKTPESLVNPDRAP